MKYVHCTIYVFPALTGNWGAARREKKIISCSGFRMLCIIKLDASARKFNNLLNFFKI